MEDDALSKLGNPCTVVPFIIKLPGMSNDGASKGIFQVLFYTGQTLPSNFEVETNECTQDCRNNAHNTSGTFHETTV